jgi:predicted anti-sigma-YlaC factor YlaD
MIAYGRDCHRHRAALTDFVDRRERGSDTQAALEHLEGCDACTWELEATAMAIMALRRLHADAAPVEPAPDAWERLRARVDRPRTAVWRWRASLAGIAVGAGLVGALLAPASLWGPRTGVLHEAGLEPSLVDSRNLEEQLAEARFLGQQRTTRVTPIHAPAAAAPPTASVPWPGPDGLGTAARLLAREDPPAGRSR